MFKSELKRKLAESEKDVAFYKKCRKKVYEAKYEEAKRYQQALKELAGIAGIADQYTFEDDWGTQFDDDLLLNDLLESAEDLRKNTEMEEREIRLMGGLDLGYTDAD